MFGISMNELRKFMGWLFALTSLISIWCACKITLHIIHRHSYTIFSLRNQFISAFFPVLAVIFGVAWWTTVKEKQSAKGWGIAASLIFVSLSLWEIVFSKGMWSSFGVMLAVGITGIILFVWPREKEAATNDIEPQNNPS
jgi:hypothetical protein